MKRHESLAPLSRDHHEALILAQLLKINAPDYNGLPDTVKDKSVYAINLFNESLLPHFASEEKMLSSVCNCHAEIKKIADEILLEHQQLTAMFLSLQVSAVTEIDLDAIGKKLEAHIRKEERVLFPLIQQHCSEDILRSIEL